MNPEEIKFAPTHEWVHFEKKLDHQLATVGLSAFALEQLSDLVFLDLPKVGAQVTAGESLGEVESVKSVSDIYSPVSGEVVEVNDRVKDELEMLSSDPFGTGWLVKIRTSNEAATVDLLDEHAYRKQCEEEG